MPGTSCTLHFRNLSGMLLKCQQIITKKNCLLHITSWNSFYSGICTSFTQIRTEELASCKRWHLRRQIRADGTKSFDPNSGVGTVRSWSAWTHLLWQVRRSPLVQKLCVVNQWVARSVRRRATKIWGRTPVVRNVPVTTLAQKYVEQLETNHAFWASCRFTAQTRTTSQLSTSTN